MEKTEREEWLENITVSLLSHIALATTYEERLLAVETLAKWNQEQRNILLNQELQQL